MKPLSWKLLLIPLLVATVFGYAVCYLLLVNAYAILRASWVNALLFSGISAVLLYLGWGVRAPKKDPATGYRTPPRYQGTVALRIAQIAIASAWTAAIMLGWYLGITLPLVLNTVYFETSLVLAENLLVAASAAGLLVCALLVEYWCRLDDDDETPLAGNPTVAPG